MAEQLLNMPMTTFLDDLASSKPAPGGGSVAALAGALGAGLVSMVCNLTLGKPKYAGVEADINDLVAKSEALRARLADLLEQDIKLYTELNTTMKMPRDTEEQKAARAKAMDTALKAATGVPMHIAETCAEVMDLCRPAADKGNVNAVSDAGVAILLAEAGLRSAALNVLINLGFVKDEAFVAENRKHLDDVLSGRPALRDEVYDYVASKL